MFSWEIEKKIFQQTLYFWTYFYVETCKKVKSIVLFISRPDYAKDWSKKNDENRISNIYISIESCCHDFLLTSQQKIISFLGFEKDFYYCTMETILFKVIFWFVRFQHNKKNALRYKHFFIFFQFEPNIGTCFSNS